MPLHNQQSIRERTESAIIANREFTAWASNLAMVGNPAPVQQIETGQRATHGHVLSPYEEYKEVVSSTWTSPWIVTERLGGGSEDAAYLYLAALVSTTQRRDGRLRAVVSSGMISEATATSLEPGVQASMSNAHWANDKAGFWIAGAEVRDNDIERLDEDQVLRLAFRRPWGIGKRLTAIEMHLGRLEMARAEIGTALRENTLNAALQAAVSPAAV